MPITSNEVVEPQEVKNSEESQWSKCKWVPQKGDDHDALDSYFCRIVLNNLEDEVPNKLVAIHSGKYIVS